MEILPKFSLAKRAYSKNTKLPTGEMRNDMGRDKQMGVGVYGAHVKTHGELCEAAWLHDGGIRDKERARGRNRDGSSRQIAATRIG